MPSASLFRWATKEDKALIVGSHLAKAGYARSVHNVLQASGPAELTMFLFDYSYAIGTFRSVERALGRPTKFFSPGRRILHASRVARRALNAKSNQPDKPRRFSITVSISEAFAMSSNGFELRITRSAK